MLKIENQEFSSRLILGSSMYKSFDELNQCIQTSETEILTVSVRREQFTKNNKHNFLDFLKSKKIKFMPNTAGCLNAKEAIQTALMAREIYQTNWIKLETVGHPYNLQPDPLALLEATKELMSQDFLVFPYMTDDLWLAEKLVNLGCQFLMPWASPIGSGRGLINEYNFSLIRKHFPQINIIIDAGIGRPSDATRVMELGADAILLNSAIAKAVHPENMAEAFCYAIKAGRKSFESGIMDKRISACASTSQINRPFWRNAGHAPEY